MRTRCFSPASIEGSNLRSNTAALASIDDPTETSEPTDNNGAPFQAIPFTDDEKTYNETTGSSNERIALWPGGIMPEAEGALTFVHKLYVNPGLLNYEHIGVEMADFNTEETTGIRSGSLFESEDPIFLSPMVDNNFVYLYGMINIDGSKGIGVARAPKEKVRERNAYKSWNGSGWGEGFEQTATLFSNVPGAVSVSYNTHLKNYIAIHSFALSNRIVLRTSDSPEGVWSEPITIFKGEVPQEGFNYAGEQHPELALQNGKVIYVSYYHPKAGFFDGDLRLVKVEFE